jgi:hypothetical protein
MFSYSTGYYVSPPDDQYLKFKNRCSLLAKLSWRWVARLVERLLATAALWVRIQTCLKNTKLAK